MVRQLTREVGGIAGAVRLIVDGDPAVLRLEIMLTAVGRGSEAVEGRLVGIERLAVWIVEEGILADVGVLVAANLAEAAELDVQVTFGGGCGHGEGKDGELLDADHVGCWVGWSVRSLFQC